MGPPTLLPSLLANGATHIAPLPTGQATTARLCLILMVQAGAAGRAISTGIGRSARRAVGPGAGRPAGAGGRGDGGGPGAAGDAPRPALQPLVVHARPGRADRAAGQPRGPLHRAVLGGPL